MTGAGKGQSVARGTGTLSAANNLVAFEPSWFKRRFQYYCPYRRSRHSSVGIAMGYRVDGAGYIPGSARFFSSSYRPDRLWDPPRFLSSGYRGWVKRQGREFDHSPPSSAEVKNGGNIPPLSHMSSWHSAELIKHRDNFTFTLPVPIRMAVFQVVCFQRLFHENSTLFSTLSQHC
jgi:hypothetical protein